MFVNIKGHSRLQRFTIFYGIIIGSLAIMLILGRDRVLAQANQIINLSGSTVNLKITSQGELTTFNCVLQEPTNTPTPAPTIAPTPTPSIAVTITQLPNASATPVPTQSQASFNSFGTVNIAPDLEANGDGSDVDTIAFYEADNPSDTLMFVTAKANQRVEVWKYPFTQQSLSLQHSCFGSNTRVNGVLVDQETDIVYIAVGSRSDYRKICGFNISAINQAINSGGSPQLGYEFTAPANLLDEPNLGLFKSQSGQKYLYASANSTIYRFTLPSGNSDLTFKPVSSNVETIYADNLNQVLYIPDELGTDGIYIYDKDGKKVGNFGKGEFQADAEGVWMYTCPADQSSDNGAGIIIVSDQLTPKTEFEVFDRQSKAHLGQITMTGVSNTDGIAMTQKALPNYPRGIFAVLNNDTSVAIVGIDKLFSTISSASGQKFDCL